MSVRQPLTTTLAPATGNRTSLAVRSRPTPWTEAGPSGPTGTSAPTPTPTSASSRAAIIACVGGGVVTILRRRTAEPAVKAPGWWWPTAPSMDSGRRGASGRAVVSHAASGSRHGKGIVVTQSRRSADGCASAGTGRRATAMTCRRALDKEPAVFCWQMMEKVNCPPPGLSGQIGRPAVPDVVQVRTYLSFIVLE